MFKKNLKEYRLAKRYVVNDGITKPYSQSDLATELGVPSVYVSFWETGKRIPNLKQLLSLCIFFKVTPNDLLDGEY